MADLTKLVELASGLAGKPIVSVDVVLNSLWEDILNNMTTPETETMVKMSKEEQANYIENLKNKWIATNKQEITMQLNNISKAYNDLSREVKQLPTKIGTVAGQLAMPTCIGPAVPNPGRILLDLKVAMDDFKTIIEDMKTKTLNLINECIKLKYVPEVIITLVTAIDGLSNILESKMGGPIAEAEAAKAKQDAIEEKLNRPIPGETLEVTTSKGTEQTTQIKNESW